MATLEPVQPSTTTAIYEAREAARAKRGNWDSVGISMSELGSDCDRALWLALRWASEQEFIDGRKDSIFETGNLWEDRLIGDVRRIPGVTLSTIDPETGKQWKVYSHGGHVRGKLDGDELIGLPEAPKTIHVLECKSHKDEQFKKLLKKKLKEAHIKHWYQCQKYMQLRHRTRCLYVAVNKDTDERYTERVEYDPTAMIQLDARLEQVILSDRAPSRIAAGPDKYPCMLCRQKEVCHSEKFGRSHCRTCVHATPILDHASNDATWLCEKFGRTLTLDDQRAGCHAHLFLPDVVPGAQKDSGDDWVAYEMRDGSTWVDQEKKAPDAPELAVETCGVCGGSKIANVYDSDGAEIEVPCGMCATRYWFHPESEALWSTENGGATKCDGLVEELSKEEFDTALAYYAELKSQGEADEARAAMLTKA